MKRNFEFLSRVELLFEGKIVDLHNHYGLTACVVSLEETRVTLNFEVVYPVNNDKQEDRPVTIELVRVSNIDMHLDHLLEGFAYGSLEDIGFKAPEDKDHSWLQTDAQSNDGDEMVFLFDDSRYIRLDAYSCTLALTPKPTLISS